MAETRQCARCGAPLPANFPEEFCPLCAFRGALELGSSEDSAPALAHSGILPSIRYFGDYELLAEIARGGMGVVYQARQLSLNRIVAVKMILAGRFAGPHAVQRFRAEAAAAARLQHPNVVAIHEVGEHDGQQYFSMDYIEGRNLAEIVRENPLAPKHAAAYLKIITEAIHCAHQQGILHRDLKPSNVLIDRFDQPRITDFGLAKQLESDTDFTVTGQVLGSPNFMPPEQAAGRHAEVGPRSDLYSLGAMLYHLLTGRPPFQGATVQEVLLQVKGAEPIGPRRLNPSVPVDLETICLKCLEKEPTRRFATAQELAEELGRFLRHEPIRARPITPLGRTWRWCRRYPAVAGLGAAVILLLILVAIGSSVAAVQIKRAESRATEKLHESYLSEAKVTRSGTRAGRRFHALDVVSKAAAIRPSLELRNEAIAALALTDLKMVWQKNGLVPADQFVCLDRELRRYALADKRGDVTIHGVGDDRLLHRLSGAGGEINWMKFNPRGDLLAIRAVGGELRLWRVADAKEILATQSRPLGDTVDFVADQDRIAIIRSDGVIAIHSVVSGELVRSLNPAADALNLTFRADGQRLAVSSSELGWVHILDVGSGQTLRRLPVGSLVFGMAWHPDGQRLATASDDRFVTLWNTETGERLEQLRGHLGSPLSLAFTSGGELLASSGWDGVIRLWDVALGQNIVTVPGGGFQLQFAPGDRALGCFNWNGTLPQVYELADTGAFRTLHRRKAGPDQGEGTADISPDGNLVAYFNGRSVKLWHVGLETELGLVPTRSIYTVLFTPDGQRLVSSGAFGVWQWPIRLDGQRQRLVVGPPHSVDTSSSQRAVHSNSNTLAVVYGDYCRIYDTHAQIKLAETEQHSNLLHVAVSHNGRWIATGAAFGRSVKIREANTGKLIQELACEETPGVIFSPDDRWLVVGTHDGYQFWDVASWKRAHRIPRLDEANVSGVMDFSLDGRIMAAAHTRTLIRLYEPSTGAEIATLESPNWQEIGSMKFSADGTKLVIARATYAVELWDLRRLRDELRRLGLDWKQPPLSPESATVPVQPLTLDVNTEGALYLGNVPRSSWDLDVPPRPPEAGPEQIDVGRHYNAPLSPSWQSVGPGQYAEGNDLAELPHGVQMLAGIRFDVRGVIQLASARTVEIGDKFPKEVAGMPVNQKCRRLHFLHNAVFGVVEDGINVAEYIVHYRDGSVERIPIVSGHELKDFWLPRDRSNPASRAEIAWRGANEMSRRHAFPVGLFKFTWQNPRPDAEIQGLDFVSAMNVPAPFLVAITAE
jgi:eukaryotic-like serine/threonine-protein kinase